MKQRLLSVCAALALTAGAFAQSWTAPTEPVRPESPARAFLENAADVEDQGNYYVMNVGEGQFMVGANVWATQISLSDNATPYMQITTVLQEGTENAWVMQRTNDANDKFYGDHGRDNGYNPPAGRNHLFRSGAIDVIGYNYHNQNVPSVPRLFPGKPFIITESVSALMTRGFYEMPSEQMMTRPVRWDRPYFNPTFSCSAYDNVATPWGSHHEENLIFLNNQPFVAGQYIWTGFDYIGEPTPYGWPARSSYFGIVDLAGFPKDVYYLYQSEWTDTPVLHLFPHWNWEPGKQIDMWCYYNNADEVELFINGKSQGTRTKDANHLHVVWNVTFEPGTVKIVARKDGVETASREIHTAGEPAQIRLTPDRSTIKSNGTDLSFVTVEILDKDGNLCPNADNLVKFEISGNGFIAGVDNGSPISLERFKDDKRKAFYGKCLVVLQNNGKKGTIKLDAVAEGLKRAHIDIKCAPTAK